MVGLAVSTCAFAVGARVPSIETGVRVVASQSFVNPFYGPQALALLKQGASAQSNARKSKVRCHVEHVFAELKSRMGLVVRTIGIARAEATITIANMAFNMKRWVFLDARSLPV